VYGAVDPRGVLHDGEPMRLDGRTLKLHLPFAERDDLELGRRADELLIRVGPHRRALVLPDSLKRREVAGARMNGDWLEVTFDDD
jgi:arsenite-transporting ATPase